MSAIGCACDPAFRSDCFAGCIVVEHEGVYYAVATFERRPQKGAPLVPSVVTREFCELVKRYGGTFVATDNFYVESIREHVTASGLSLVEAPSGHQGKAQTHIVVQELLHGGRVRFAQNQTALISQLRDIVSKPLPAGGISISSPRKKSGHGDLASAWVLATWAARTSITNAQAHAQWLREKEQSLRSMDRLFAGRGHAGVPPINRFAPPLPPGFVIDENGNPLWQPRPSKAAGPAWTKGTKRPVIGYWTRYVPAAGGDITDPIYEGDEIPKWGEFRPA